MAKNNIRLKNEEDIKNLRIGGKRLAFVINEVSKLVAPGVTTEALNSKFNQLVLEGGDVPVLLGYQPFGADYPYPASVCISLNDEVVHGIPSQERIIQNGDLVKIDGCLSHNGMIVDHAITVPCGEINDELKKLIEVTKEARKIGINNAKNGNYIRDIGSSIEKFVNNRYGIVKILSGHGVGFAVHEEPYVPNYDDGIRGPKLVPGMVIAIEPMLNIGTDDCDILEDGYTFVTMDGSYSAHFEHTVLITENGPEILTIL
jgi:methionyl aminopeptidase